MWKKLIKDKYSLQLQHYHLWVCVAAESGSPMLQARGPRKERVTLVLFKKDELINMMINHF